MGKLVVNQFITLDGVFEAPEKWSFPYWNDELSKAIHEENNTAEAILLGRRTYDIFAAAWPSRTDESGLALKINTMPKYVASRTLKSLAWSNSHLLGADPFAEVRGIKETTELLTMPGSGAFGRELVAHGLVDELRLLTYPLVLGTGERFFASWGNVSLELLETRPMGSGVILQRYRPVH